MCNDGYNDDDPGPHAAASYAVTDDSGVEYATSNPWLCPDPGSDNVPSGAGLSQAASGQVHPLFHVRPLLRITLQGASGTPGTAFS